MDKNKRSLLLLVAMVAAMAGLSFASVPLYQMFCKLTGFGGTTQTAAAAPEADEVRERTITVRFNADVNRDLPWEFRPEQVSVTAKIGEVGETKYYAKNLSDQAIVGTATYNVQPDSIGLFFHKIQCFCFEQQVLQPGQEMEFPVTYFIEPALDDDPAMADVTEITLSYTFFRAKDQSLAAKKP